MTPSPKRSIRVRAYNGGEVTFYPSDIKALASLAWGETPPIVRFAGSRCKSFNPREDEVGRVTNDGCFDVNPATFHLAVVNHIGRGKRSFVLDATFDWEVWNYPIYAYHYHYFNPQTLAVSANLNGSVVRRSQYSIDKFRRYRNSEAKSFVGVAMDITYAIPTQPSRKVITKQTYQTVRYVYDLELNDLGEIVGGEWYSNFHPDFVWSPPVESRALSNFEKNLEIGLEWDGRGPVSADVHKAAVVSSAKGEPLAVVVERLVQLGAETGEITSP